MAMMRFVSGWISERRTGARCWPERAPQSFAIALGKTVPLQRLAVFVIALAMLMQPCVALADQPVEVVSAAHVARIKDLTSVEGVRDNMLIGYGLVVGLAGSGGDAPTH